jgi:hypothetical protein
MGSVGGNPPERQTSSVEGLPEAPKESKQVHLFGIVVQYLIHETFESSVVNDGKHTKRAVI